ncbi:MAG: hypothetical protein AXW12_15240 [Thalassospira sp. Nap_22]|nr:MAG: hypothetical protein AXW12_15240 [Thalassospira sp. Nap_22]
MSKWAVNGLEVCRFSRPDGTNVIPRRKNPELFGYVEHLYGPLELEVVKQIDDQGAKALNALLDAENPRNLPNKTREEWAALVLSFLLRSPTNISQLKHSVSSEYRTELDDLSAKYEDLLKEQGYTSIEDFIQDTQADSVEAKVFQLIGTLIKHRDIVQLIANMHWAVIDLQKSDYELLTSDNPVWMTETLGQSDSFLTLPVTPTKLFVAANSLTIVQTLTSRKPLDLVKVRNKITVQHSENIVVGTDDTMLNFVSKHFATRRRSTLSELLARKRSLPIVDVNSPQWLRDDGNSK